jgi:hypothetical protein
MQCTKTANNNLFIPTKIITTTIMIRKISFCVSMIYLLICSTGLEAQTNTSKFIKIFDGKTMNGWEGDTSFWRIENNCFIGEVTPEKPLKSNTFLIWRGFMPDHFEFKAQYRISANGNSGINYRSEEVPGVPFGLKGYQADIDGENQYTGQNYEERGRGFLAMRGQQAVLKEKQNPTITGSVGNTDELKATIKLNDWNDIHIIVNGNVMKHYINGVLMSETTDEDVQKQKFGGLLGLQVHVMQSMKVEYRKIYLKEIIQ